MDKSKFSEMYEAGFLRTVAFLVSRGVQSDAEEFAQAAWARGWERRDQIRDPGTCLVWINSIALNLVREHFRRSRSFEDVPVDLAMQPGNVAATIDAKKLLSACSAGDRLALEQCYLYGYTSTEVAGRSGCSSVTVRVRVARAISKLRDMRDTGSRRTAKA